MSDLSPSTINRHITAAQRIDLRMAPKPKPDGSGVVWGVLIGLALIVAGLVGRFAWGLL